MSIIPEGPSKPPQKLAVPPQVAPAANVGADAPDFTPPPVFEEEAEQAPAPPSLKLFTRADVVPAVNVSVYLPRLYPDYEPWEFKFRLTFSKDMQAKRDAFLNLAPIKQNETEEVEILEECCDLLAQDPKGFGDWPTGTTAPGDKLRNYVNTTTNPAAKQMLMSILRAANNYYWASVTPREYFQATKDSGS